MMPYCLLDGALNFLPRLSLMGLWDLLKLHKNIIFPILGFLWKAEPEIRDCVLIGTMIPGSRSEEREGRK